MPNHKKRKQGGLATVRRMAGGGALGGNNDLIKLPSTTKKPNELSGVVLAGASWMAGDEKTRLAKQLFGDDVTNTAIGGQKTSDVLNQLNVFERDGGTFAPGTTVVLDVGANDIAQGVDEDTIRNNLNEIVSRLGEKDVKVILSGQPEAHSYEEAINRTDLRMDDLYSEIAANNPNVTLVDAMSDLLNQKDLMDESRFHLKDDESKLSYLSKFADAYKDANETKQDDVAPPSDGGLTQINKPDDKYTPEAEINFAPEVIPPEVDQPVYEPSAGYRSVTEEGGMGLDTYYQNINNYVAENHTPEEIQAAMEQYGVSQADVDAARDWQGSVAGKTGEQYSQELYAKGGGVRMQVGGLMTLLNAGKAGAKLTKAEMAALRSQGLGVPGIDFADPLNPKDIMRMSEALGAAGAEGKTLNLTQADRSRVFGPNKGGTGFSGLQLTSPAHQQAGTTWGVGKPSHVTRMINANTPDTIWSPFIGSPTQHMSNPVTVERMYEAHKKAGPSAELVEKMNKQLNSAIHAKTKKPIFPNGIDISDPASLTQAKTFDQRKAIAQALTIGGEKKGEKATQEAFKIIKEETDPLLMDAPTYAVGNRLFTIDKNTGIYRPDLNSAFPEQTVGTDLGLIFEPAPIQHAAPDFVKKFEGRKNKHGNPQPMGHKDLTATTPKQFIDEAYLTNLQKEGYQDGGSVNPSFTQRLQSAMQQHMAEGGSIDNTTPDITDSGNVIASKFFANGGAAQIPVRSLKQIKPRRYAEAGMVEALGAPDYETSPKDSRMVELAGRMIKDQAKKEGAVLSTPEGRRDIALKVASHMPGLGMGGDLVALADWVQTLIPGLYKEKYASVLEEAAGPPPAPFRDVRELQRVPKFPLRNLITLPTGEEFQQKFKEMGIQGENEAPVTEFVGSLLAPGAAMKAPRKIEGGLNAVTAAARRPFTPATATVEAVSPDLAKFKNQAFQDYTTKQMIGEGAAVPMTTMGGRKTSQKSGQGAYLNEAGELEYNPMLGVNIPRAGNLSKNKALRADIATAGQELGQEAMAAHRFVPMATNQIKDASAMMIRGPGGRPLTNKEVMALANELPGMIATHSPANGGMMVAPFGMTKGQVPEEFLTAQSVARKVLGKDAKIQFGKADEKKDLMYMPRSTYVEEGGRGTTPAVQATRNSLKRMDKNFPVLNKE